MSNALALAAVTAVLKDRLDNALVDHSVVAGGAVTVTAVAPDLVQVGAGRPPQLNLFLYRVSPNAAWRNAELPSHTRDGARAANPPLALDLHYLLTAYGSQDFQAEVLLGYAMQVLHEAPVLSPEAVRTTLSTPSPVNGALLPAGLGPLSAAALAEQEDGVRIVPEALDVEAVSKLWPAFNAPYRPSAAYRVGVVLIRRQRPTRAALPVLTLGLGDRGPTVVPDLTPPVPTLTAVTLPEPRPAAHLGDALVLSGHHLGGADVRVAFAHARLPEPLVVPPASATDGEVVAPLSLDPATDAATWPAGLYGVSVTLAAGGVPRQTNTLPLALAPLVTSASAATAGGETTVTVGVAPEVRPEQAATLVVGDRAAPAEGFAAPTGTLRFVFDEIPAGTHPLRLRVDGVESVLVDRTTTPPSFRASQLVTV